MNEQKNNAPEQAKPEKKLSRTTLTFYIVGLFSVAIALILISYVAQAPHCPYCPHALRRAPRRSPFRA